MGHLINKNTYFFILDLIAVLITALVFIPQIGLVVSTAYLTLFLVIIWVFLTFNYQSLSFLKDTYILLSILCFSIMAFIPFVVGNTTLMNRAIGLSPVVVFYYIYKFNVTHRNNKANIKILYISFVFILYTTIQTIIGLKINPFASRMIKTDISETADIIMAGVSGYSLIYAVVIIIIALIPLLMNRNKLNLNVLQTITASSIILLFVYLIILSNYFTALIMTVAGSLLLLIGYKKKKVLIVIIPAFILFFILRFELITLIADIILLFSQEEGKTYIRLLELKDSIGGAGNLTDLDTRSNLLSMNLKVFADFPFLGYIAGASHNFNIDKIGQHSTMLDTLALYGFFIGILFVWIMWLPFREIKKRYNDYKSKMYANIVGLSFMFLILNNNLTVSMGYASFFFFPTIMSYINNNSDQTLSIKQK